MRWNKFTIKTTTEAEDLVIASLADIGIEGVEIEDKVPLSESDKKQMFVDILPDVPDDDGIAYLSFYVDADGEASSAQDAGGNCPEGETPGARDAEGNCPEGETPDARDAGEKCPEGENPDARDAGGNCLDGTPLCARGIEEILEEVHRELEDLRSFVEIGEGTITVSQTEDKDWINNWKEYFHQFYVDDILIIPSWEEVKAEDRGKMIIHIDPGTAFGTGMHETTQLCLRQLKKYVTDQTELLDVGTGSGILSIAALKLGARHALGTDLDPCAISAVRENLEANEIPAGAMDVLLGNIIDDQAIQDAAGYGKYDIVTANILAEVLLPLTPVIVNHLKHGGIYITSGIIEDKEGAVVDAVKSAGLEVLEVTRQNDWVSVTARKA